MKLRNKKTGEIVDLVKGHICESVSGESIALKPNIASSKTYTYDSLAELNEEWEDYEEPKEHWAINEFGTPELAGRFDRENIYDKARKLIGNDFETKEEAEKAVEKLKAWKRLNDGGFYFTIDAIEDGEYRHNLILRLKCNEESKYKPIKECEQYLRDIHLLFGGKE